MPIQELPDEFFRPIESPSNSSISSNSSDVILIDAHYVRTSRSASVSSSTTTNTQDEEDSFDVNVQANHLQNRPRDRNDEEEEVTYQPIKLPTEPTLEELLRQVTGSGDIRTVQQIKLRIISSAISLQRLPYFMPHLRCLNLEGSMLFSLRDLGCDLSSLVYLNISRCGLKSLDGTNGLSTLIELIADFNLIEDAGPCSNLPHIRKISLISNKIKDFSGMMFLGLCNQLQVLDMTNNVIAQKELYRETVHENVPQLMILDKVPYEPLCDEQKVEMLQSEYQPTNNGTGRRLSQTSRLLGTTYSEFTRLHIPETRSAVVAAPAMTHISIGRRPMTSDGSRAKYDVSVGEPVCGNIVTKARKPRKLKTAWGESCSSSSFSSSDSSNQGTPRNSRGTNPINGNEACDVLLETARQWREKSKENREKFRK